MVQRKLVFAAAIAASVFACLPGISGGAEEIDRILVIVNDDVITEGEYEARFRGIVRELRSRSEKELPPPQVLRRQILERMITEKIQLQRAERLGIQVENEMVERAVMSVAAQNKMSVEEFRQAVARDGLSFDRVRQNLKDQLIIRTLVERDVLSRVVVSDEEVDSFLSGPAARSAGKEFHLSHILIRVPESADSSVIGAARTRAAEALERIRAGADFGRVAATYSQAEDALEGGELGWRQPGQLPGLFLEAVDALKPGETTDVIRSPNGFHILKVNELRGAATSEVLQYQVRHILIKTDEFISVSEATRRLEQIRERIVNGEDFATLARSHSDDTVSSVRGGELGWISSGDVVRPFGEAVERLEVGALSRPVRTPYGMHLIQVLDRKKVTVDVEVDRANARQQLRALKSDERYEQWIQRLRDESYIEVLKTV